MTSEERLFRLNYAIQFNKELSSVFFYYKFIYLFIYLWRNWVFIAECGLSLGAASRGYSSLWCVDFSHCCGFSCCRAWALGTLASVVVARGLSSCGSRALECRLSSCGAWA